MELTKAIDSVQPGNCFGHHIATLDICKDDAVKHKSMYEWEKSKSRKFIKLSVKAIHNGINFTVIIRHM